MLTLLLLACHDPSPVDSGATGTVPFTLRGSDFVGLPYSVAGAEMGTATLTVENVGDFTSVGGLTLDVPDPFEVTGDTGPMEPGEVRDLTVSFGGNTAVAGLFTDEIGVAGEGQRLTVKVAAVVGDAELPEIQWTSDAFGERATVEMPSAPFPYGDAPYDDASVLVYLPTSFTDDEGVNFVTHLHGHSATLEGVLADQHLVEQHALSGRDAVLVVPQGPVDAADSDFGRLDETNGLHDLLRDVITVLYRDERIERPDLGGVALTAHSGGYAATANILERGGVDVAAVHLFDALYDRADVFARHAGEGKVLRSVYTATGGTADENEALADELASDGLFVGDSFADDDLDLDLVTVADTWSSHAGCVTDERSYARWLTASGLPVRPAAAPELRSVVSDGTTATVTWREDPGGQPLIYRVEGSWDGDEWSLLASTDESSADVDARPWIRLVRTDVSWGDSDVSDVYGGSGAEWLVIDGFDRVLDGSYTAGSHPFAAWLGNATGDDYSTASNEAVAAGDVNLGAFGHVLWMLGDESTADVTFDDAERAAIEGYLAGGGKLIVTGSEVGYASDRTWLRDVLGVTYVADDAGTDVVEGLTLGEAYPEDYPDVLDGEEVLWEYQGGGGAVVLTGGQVMVVGFGLENLPADLRDSAIEGLLERLG